ncbi:MAG: acyl-CoA carboxylase subunit epsilon [Bifidobacteriaceae bacterium]|jgi:hypothetical protein|nr:acyl-CoA carboxylase subunit epsilon [Bifidobacteriaceae bacterium]
MTPATVIVAKGEPTAPELVALVTALTALAVPAHDPGPVVASKPSAWGDRTRLLGTSAPGAASAWRRSYLP